MDRTEIFLGKCFPLEREPISGWSGKKKCKEDGREAERGSVLEVIGFKGVVESSGRLERGGRRVNRALVAHAPHSRTRQH